MKKVLIAVLVLLSIGNWLWCDLQEHYKKGKIVLKGVEGFGEGNDWEDLFYDHYKDIVVAPDGSIFVANSRTHNIFKFDNRGKMVKRFGRRGKEPGDFVSPGDPSILDNKYLVVGEYASNRRFSLWDLNGKYIKVVKTQTSIFYLTALRDNRVAYYYYSRHGQEKNDYQDTISIIIKNIDSGKEKVLKKITLLDRSGIKFGKRGIASYGSFFGQVYLAQTINGNLAVGVSNQPKINIFSPTGELIRSFDLKMVPVPVSEVHVKNFRDYLIAKVKKQVETAKNSAMKDTNSQIRMAIKRLDVSTLFDKHLPLYKEILVDSEGNFLIFKYTRCHKHCNSSFQVYSNEGTFICETKLDSGKYDLNIDRRFRKLRFTSDGVFSLLMEKGDEDEIYRLIKSDYSPTP